MLGIFKITDGTAANTIDLLLPPYSLCDWTPALPEPKDGGIWQSSPFADGRRMAYYKLSNILENMTISITGSEPDEVIALVRKLRNLLDRARDYWVSPMVNTPVYLAVRGEKETNTRYAVINDYRIPQDNNPFTPTMVDVGRSAMVEMPAAIEHGLWQNYPVGDDICIDLEQIKSETLELTSKVSFEDTTTTNPDLHSAVISGTDFDNLTDTYSLTIEAWIYPTQNNPGMIISKTTDGSIGWIFSLNSSNKPSFSVDFATTNASALGNTAISLDTWTHIAVSFNVSTKVIRIFVNGVEVTYESQVTGNGSHPTDAAAKVVLGSYYYTSGATYFHGYIGWVRMWKSLHYTTTFTPEGQTKPPAYHTDVLMATRGGASFIYRSASAPAITSSTFSNGLYVYFSTDTTISQYGVNPTDCEGKGYLVNGFYAPYPLTNDAPLLLYYYDSSAGLYYPIVNCPYTLPTYGAGDYLYIVSSTPLHVIQIPHTGLSFTTIEYWNNPSWTTFQITMTTFTGSIFIHRQEDYDGEDTQTWFGMTRYVYRLNADHTNGIITSIPFIPSEVPLVIKNTTLLGDLPTLVKFYGNCLRESSGDITKIILATRSTSRGAYSACWKAEYGTISQTYECETGEYHGSLLTETNENNLFYNRRAGRDSYAKGKYHAFLRGWQVGGVAGDITVTIRHINLAGKILVQNEPLPTTEYGTIDLGIIDLSYLTYDSTYAFNIYAQNDSTGTLTYIIVDIVLMPIDELYIELTADDFGQFEMLSTTDPKNSRQININVNSSGIVTSLPITISGNGLISCVGAPTIKNDEDHYVFALFFDGNLSTMHSWGFLGVNGLSRYNSMRGAT